MVIPLCAISLTLQMLFCPKYRLPTDKSVWAHIKEIDWVGNLLHMATCLFFAAACTFLGSVDVWGVSTAVATWTIFTFILVSYVIQQAFNIGTSPANRLLAPASLLKDRTVILTWICTFCAAAAYGTTLNYLPLYFAFTRGLGPLPGATRLLPFIGVFIFFIMLAGALLPVARYYKFFFLVGSSFLLIGGSVFQALDPEMPDAAIMGFETIIAAGLGILWQLGVPVCTTFLRSTEDRLDLALLSNMAQLGGIAASLSIASMVFQSTGFESLQQVLHYGRGFTYQDIRELLSGLDSPILKELGPDELQLVVGAITNAIRNCLVILLVTGVISFIAAWCMKLEALEFKKPVSQQELPPETSLGTLRRLSLGLPLTRSQQIRHQPSGESYLLGDVAHP